MFGALGKLFLSVTIAVTTLFNGHVYPPTEPVNVVTKNTEIVASTTLERKVPLPVKNTPTHVQYQAPAAPTISDSQASGSNIDLAIKKCESENASWLAAWPALEQSIREKVRRDYQGTILEYMKQYRGVITAGDVASSTSSSIAHQEQQAVNLAKTKFDLAGTEFYQKCLSTIRK